ncbi:MAG: hypothetical protein SO160_13680 [Lachnospiraceae bacterium]|nr:hypothetical protein [Lachnospiraceae bacterium]
MTQYDVLDEREKKVQWSNDKCDKYDYMIAVSCGALAGLIDIFFVGGATTKTAELSRLGRWSDATTDEIVKKIAKALGWNPRPGKENNMSSAISYLEKKFPVPYEHTSTKEVGGNFQMSAKNHHFKSLAHSPDPIGMLFSILDQFTNSGSFLSDGKLIRISAEGRGFELQGTNFISKIFCGFCNWIGHLLSDVAGSNGSRAVGNVGRGTGLPIPFMELFLVCNFGKFQIGDDRQTLADLMTRAFQEGYDLRHGGAMAIPVILEEAMIRVLWAIKRKFYHHREWKDCVPTEKHADLRMMLLVGNATMCLFDGTHAAIKSSGNALKFVLHMNLIAWARLIVLVFKELKIRYGSKVDATVSRYLAEFGLNDKDVLTQYYARMNTLNQELDQALTSLVQMVEKEYKAFIDGVDKSLNPNRGTAYDRSKASVEFARSQKVPEDRIFMSTEEMKYWLEGGK